MEHDGIKGILASGKMPGITGCSTGPGSAENQFVANRPNLEKEYRLTFKAMEEAGRLRDPQIKKQVEFMYNWAKSQPPEKIDYSKDGYSFDD